MTNENPPTTRVGERSSLPTGLVISGIILIVVAIFVAQNTEDVPVNFLMFEWNVPQWLLIVLALIFGAILGQTLAYMRRRKKKRAN